MTWTPVIIPPGLTRISTPHDVKNAWWDSNNVRWVSGAMIPVGGNIRLTSTPFTSTVRKLFQWRDNSGGNWVVAGLEQGIFINPPLQSAWTDITPAAFVPLTAGAGSTGGGFGVGNYGAEAWGTPRAGNPIVFRTPPVAPYYNFANFGQTLLAIASSDGRLLQFDPTAPMGPMTVVANAPLGNTAVVVTSERAVMLLGASGDPRRIAWSDFESPTGWNFAGLTNQAGYLEIEATTPIVGGMRVKEGILVLTQREAFLVRYVGPPYFYGVERIGQTIFSCPYAITAAGNMVTWFGDESFWKYDGGAVTPVSCPFFNDLTNELNADRAPYRAHMEANGLFPEVWFEYPDNATAPSDDECSRYLIWNYAFNWWGRGSRRRTAALGATTAKYPVAAGLDGHLYEHENGWTDAGVSRVGSVWAETSVLNMSDQSGIFDINQALVARDDAYSVQNYAISILSSFAPDQVETTYGPYTPRADGYTDVRATGRDIRMRIEATQDGYWSLGEIRLDVTADYGVR